MKVNMINQRIFFIVIYAKISLSFKVIIFKLYPKKICSFFVVPVNGSTIIFLIEQFFMQIIKIIIKDKICMVVFKTYEY